MANIGSSNQQVSILPFDGENYDFWFVKMKTIFKSLGLWESVVEGFTEPNTTEGMTENQKKKLDEKRQKDASALSLIQKNVTDPIFPRIMRVESAKEAWETLRNEFQSDDKVRAIKLQSLRKDLENMKMKEDETLKDYSSRFLELINQMKTHGEDISNQRIVEKILISLPEKFDPIVAVIEETKDLSTLSVQEVMASLKSYEQRMARHTEKAVETSLLSRFMQAPSHFHLGAAKRVLRYIQGTIDYGIMNGRSKEVKLTGFCDSDFGGCKDDMKSTSGYCFTLGSGVFSWLSKKQQSVAQSSAET
ncbi:hypothetical protein RJ640_013976 [Escallonia rubra]|uniref:DUF4219 domain-containing protein n=1 Tax=Escallonia rubra TaxID=112253 RepID=A0AA88RJC8_9ASTE|nr:hypothetical protein RJ640_013976 [Escallonia rubra]